MGQGYEKLQRCCESCRNRIPFAPKLALILGSGLGDYAENFPIEGEIPYRRLRAFRCQQYPATEDVSSLRISVRFLWL